LLALFFLSADIIYAASGAIFRWQATESLQLRVSAKKEKMGACK